MGARGRAVAAELLQREETEQYRAAAGSNQPRTADWSRARQRWVFSTDVLMRDWVFLFAELAIKYLC